MDSCNSHRPRTPAASSSPKSAPATASSRKQRFIDTAVKARDHRRDDRRRRAPHRGHVVREPARGAAACRCARDAVAASRGARTLTSRRWCRTRAAPSARSARAWTRSCASCRRAKRTTAPTSMRRSTMSLANVAEVAAIVRGKVSDARRGRVRVRLPVRRRGTGRGGNARRRRATRSWASTR